MQSDSSKSSPDYLKIKGQRIARRRSVVTPVQDTASASQAPHLVFCGGFHSNMLGVKAEALARFCEQQDWSYTRFDYRGHGESDGDAESFTMADWLDDVLCVLDDTQQPVLLVGSSMGAWLATLAACRRLQTVGGLLLLAAAPDFLQELIYPKLSPSDIWDLQQDNVVRLPNAYADPYPITQALIDSGTRLSLLDDGVPETQSPVYSLKCPVRMIHGTADTDVPFSLALRLMDRLSHADAQLTLLHQSDHRLSTERELTIVQNTLMELVRAMTTDISSNNG